jgi:hypothetical protein
MFGEEDRMPSFINPDDGAWPPQRFRLITPRQQPCTYELQVLKSPNFGEEFEDVMNKWPHSPNFTGGSLAGEPLLEDDDSAPTESDIYIMQRSHNVRYRHPSRSASISTSVSIPSKMHPDSKLPDLSAFKIRFDNTSTTQTGLEVDLDQTRAQTPTTNMSPSTTLTASPNTMNRLNEEDPAFQRTVNALLRSPEPEEKLEPAKSTRPASYILTRSKIDRPKSPIRAKTSLGMHAQRELEKDQDKEQGTKMEQLLGKSKFTNFLDRLRRRPYQTR